MMMVIQYLYNDPIVDLGIIIFAVLLGLMLGGILFGFR